MNILLSPLRSPRSFQCTKPDLEKEAFEEWMRANKIKKKKLSDDDREESTIVLPPVRRKKKPRWLKPAGVSAWGKMQDARWKADQAVLDIDPGPQGVNLNSSRHRNPGSIPPLGVKSGVKKRQKDVDCSARHPPVGSYSLPDLWNLARKKKYQSKFAKEADAVFRAASDKDSWSVFNSKHTLPFSDEEKKALKKRREYFLKRNGDEGHALENRQRRGALENRQRRGAVFLEGKDNALADGRDNLLIHALLREEQDRKMKPVVKDQETLKGEDQAFEEMFAQHVALQPDELQVIIQQSEQEILEAI